MAAMGINEIQWAKEHARPRINVYRSTEASESPGDYISLLDRFLQLAPYLSPGPFRTSLSHPDLHLDNIFVDPDTEKMIGIIDWQSASVSEPFLQHSIPRMLLPVRSRHASNLVKTAPKSPNGREGLDGAVDLLSHYQNLTMLKNEQHWAAINLHNRSLLTRPVSLLCGAWNRDDVFSFRHALVHAAARWKEFGSETSACPIQFTKNELELHHSELELIKGLGEVLHQLKVDNLIPLGGMVLRENHEQALRVNNTVRDMFIDMAESESQKELFSRIWPYQDRGQ